MSRYVQVFKEQVLRAVRLSGASSLILNSSWRRKRLLILCYHGVSLLDEHRWNPGLYLSPELFRRRLERLRRRRCNILPLGEAVDRLFEGTLPPRSVALTFDDGFHDFAAKAWPLLREFDAPATVYLTTYYVEVQHPVFDVAVSYIGWKSSEEQSEWPEVFGPGSRPIRADRGNSAAEAVRTHSLSRNLSAAEKFELLQEFAARLRVDFEEIRRRRILYLMTPEEVAQISAQGCDVQLHTHRHRVSKRRERFLKELDDNSARIQRMTGVVPNQFCYPGGYWLDELPAWLEERQIRSATTCDLGMANAGHRRFYLPRVLDVTLPDNAFDGWITGFSELISRHAQSRVGGQLFHDEEESAAGQGAANQ